MAAAGVSTWLAVWILDLIDRSGARWHTRPRPKRDNGSLLRGGLPGIGFQDAAEGFGANHLLGVPMGGRIVNMAIQW
jgi:hypothetical protein